MKYLFINHIIIYKIYDWPILTSRIIVYDHSYSYTKTVSIVLTFYINSFV